MRPTDEDQSGSRRPNLMSSTRRTANETNILAMLDRHESGGRLRRLLRGLGGLPVMVWYGTAGLLVAGLVGSLAWLALDNGPASTGNTALSGSAGTKIRPVTEAPAIAAPPAPVPAAVTASASAGASAEVVDEAQAAGATIVDLAPAGTAEAAEPLTALRVLPPQQHAGRIAQHEDRRESQRELPPERPRPASHAATSRSASRGAAGKAVASAARAPGLAHAEPRSRRPAAQARPAPGAVDTDVALISAIIQHANKRQEAEEAAAKP
ncbi:hypothetical protein [Massilia aerilata]|uniref:Uncharacterized protein n=1 Tax=Massilia aerilata TaxID=453817 RepID=A0ABW0RVT6_9BURK